MVGNCNNITNEVNFLIKKYSWKFPMVTATWTPAVRARIWSQELEPAPVTKKPKLPNIKLL